MIRTMNVLLRKSASGMRCFNKLVIIRPERLTRFQSEQNFFVVMSRLIAISLIITGAILSAPNDLVGLYQGHTGAVNHDITNGSWVYSASEDGTAIKWSLETNAQIRKYQDHGGPVNSVFAYGVFIYTTSDDQTLKKWDASSGESVTNYFGSCFSCVCEW